MSTAEGYTFINVDRCYRSFFLSLRNGIKGCNAILEMATDLPSPSSRETAYAWAVYMVVSDRKLVSPEQKFLEVLRKKFGIHGALVNQSLIRRFLRLTDCFCQHLGGTRLLHPCFFIHG